jgi:hypothetical protein
MVLAVTLGSTGGSGVGGGGGGVVETNSPYNICTSSYGLQQDRWIVTAQLRFL